MNSEYTIADVITVRSRTFRDSNGTLSVVDQSDLPLPVVRAFWVTAGRGVVRGQHAHRRCKQLMYCVHGRCEIEMDDGRERRVVALGDDAVGLLVPCGVWAEERFVHESNVLLVLCDRPYEEDDYIRDYREFCAYRAARSSSREAP